MHTSIEPWQNSQVHLLVDQARRIDQEIDAIAKDFSGLLDIDLALRSATLHLEIANLVIRTVEDTANLASHETLHTLARESACQGVMRLEEVSAAENAGGDLTTYEQFVAAQNLFHDLILAGGGALLEGDEIDALRKRRIADAVCTALSKYASPDDVYQVPISQENLPSWLQKVTSKVVPSFIRNRVEDPLGIEEGEEQSIVTDVVRMPLSQAILYYEEELLPDLYEQIAINPGSDMLQKRIAAIEERLKEYRRMKFIPRSTPLILPHGYYTDGIAGYTSEGELLVSVPLQAEMSSGTNLDRTQNLVQSDIVRRLAGKGVCNELDAQYARAKSYKSGLRGSRFAPSFTVANQGNFRKLKSEYPALRMIDNRYQFKLLVDAARKGQFKKIRKAVSNELSGKNGTRLLEGNS